MMNQDGLDVHKVTPAYISLESTNGNIVKIESVNESMSSLNAHYNDIGGRKVEENGFEDTSYPPSAQLSKICLDPKVNHSQPRIRRHSRPCPESKSLNCTEPVVSQSKRSSEPLDSSSSSGVATMSSSQDLALNESGDLAVNGSGDHNVPEVDEQPGPSNRPASLGREIIDGKRPTTSTADDEINLYAIKEEVNVALDKELLQWYATPHESRIHQLPMYFCQPPNPKEFSASELPQSFFRLITNTFRKIISQRRRRLELSGFDLDLTYITDRIVAMGYPAKKVEALYRNQMGQTKLFMDAFHPNLFWVFNLRGRFAYDPGHFDRRVTSFEMEDHHPPRLEFMAPFCRQTELWLEEDPRHIIAVHCKAGKGRTGVMICAYLAHINFFPNPRQVIDYYSIVRTHNNQGVTIPSQRRYIYYYDHLRKKNLNYVPLRCELQGVYLEGLPEKNNPYYIKVRVTNGDVVVYESSVLKITNEVLRAQKNHATLFFPDPYHPINNPSGLASRFAFGWPAREQNPVFLEGDIQVQLIYADEDEYRKQSSRRGSIDLCDGFKRKIPSKQRFGHVWFNTMFTCPGYCDGHFEQSEDSRIPLRPSAFKRDTYIRRAREEDPVGLVVPPASKLADMMEPQDPLEDRCLPCRTDASRSDPIKTQHLRALRFVEPQEGERLPRYSQWAISKLRSSASSVSQDDTKVIGKSAKWLYKPDSTTETKEPSDPIYRKLIYFNGRVYEPQPNPADGSLTFKHDDVRDVEANTQEWGFKEPVPDLKQLSTRIPRVRVAISEPPKLESHCPRDTLPLLYSNRRPPREDISSMMRVAFHNDLIRRFYDKRTIKTVFDPRNAVPRCHSNTRVEGGPYNLHVNQGEHLLAFDRFSIDGAHKTHDQEITDKLKLFVITKCITSSMELEKGQKFVQQTRKRQQRIDFIAQTKRELDQIKRKTDQCVELVNKAKPLRLIPELDKARLDVEVQAEISSLLPEEDLTLEMVIRYKDPICFEKFFMNHVDQKKKEVGKRLNDMKTLEAAEGIEIYLHPTLNGNRDLNDEWDKPSELHEFKTNKVVAAKSMKGEDNKMVAKFNNNPRMDPRYESDYYKKFFYRQREGSPTRYPNIHHHCPLDSMDRQICNYYNCPLVELESPIDENGELVRVPDELVDDQSQQMPVPPFHAFKFDSNHRPDHIPLPLLSELNEKEKHKYFPSHVREEVLSPSPMQVDEAKKKEPVSTRPSTSASKSSKKSRVVELSDHVTNWSPLLSLDEENLPHVRQVMVDDRSQVEDLTFARNHAVVTSRRPSLLSRIWSSNSQSRQASVAEESVSGVEAKRRRTQAEVDEVNKKFGGTTPYMPCGRFCQCVCSGGACKLNCECHLLYQVQQKGWDKPTHGQGDVVQPMPSAVKDELKDYLP